MKSLNFSVSIPKFKKSCDGICLILKALSHPQRLLILGYLLNGSKSVSQLVELCGISQPQVSHFLTRMKFEGLIKSHRKGKYHYYSVADQRLSRLLRTIQEEYCNCN